MPQITRPSCPYNAYFCEENAWLIAQQLTEGGTAVDRIEILLFSNASESALLYQQRGAPPGQALIWDYHVVVRVRQGQDVIIDPDSRLDLPCAARDYLQQTFGDQAVLPAALRTRVRVIPARSYLERFHSDRSHMRGQIPDSEFPDYPCIEGPPSRRIPLAAYRDLDRELDDGSHVLDASVLIAAQTG